MKPIYWILIVAAALILIYGYNKGWFNNPKNLQTPPTNIPAGTTQTIPARAEGARIESRNKALSQINASIQSARHKGEIKSTWETGGTGCTTYGGGGYNGHKGVCCTEILKDGHIVGEACAYW